MSTVRVLLYLDVKSVIFDSEQHISPYIFYFSTNANFFRSANVTVLAPIFEPKVQKIANNIKKKNEENLFYVVFLSFSIIVYFLGAIKMINKQITLIITLTVDAFLRCYKHIEKPSLDNRGIKQVCVILIG